MNTTRCRAIGYGSVIIGCFVAVTITSLPPVAHSSLAGEEKVPLRKENRNKSIDLLSANLLHRHFQKTCTWPGISISYDGALGGPVPQKAVAPNPPIDTYYRWSVVFAGPRDSVGIVLFQFVIDTENRKDAVASLQVEQVTFHCYLAPLGADESPEETKKRLETPITAFKGVKELQTLTPRDLIKCLFSK